MKKERDYQIDNCKAILIFLVVLGHLFEHNVTDKTHYMLLVMYTFHMPLFIFFSGYLAKYNPKKIIHNIVIPYLCVQLFAYIFYSIVDGECQFRILSGYQSLWYMISLFCWYLTIPFFEKSNHPTRVLLISAIFGLLIGYDNSIGSQFSLSRTFVFFPFFISGFYCKKYMLLDKIRSIKNAKLISIFLIIFIAAYFWIEKDLYKVVWFWEYKSYFDIDYTPLIRVEHYLLGLIWLFIFISLVPRTKLYISKIGQNTISIYLLHCMIINVIAKFGLLNLNSHPTLTCLVFAILLTFILSRKYFVKIFKH